LRNEITPSKQTIVGTKEYLSSVKAKKVKGREERGEKKRSKLRGGVERGRNVPDKSIEHTAKRVFPVARRVGGDDLSPPFQRRAWHAGMPHRLSVNHARCEAADGPSPLCVR
jgi:hypothetical protein